MRNLKILEGQVIVRVEWGSWPNGHVLEVEVEDGHILEIGPDADWKTGEAFLDVVLNDDALR